jgi:primosomal protein N' (replication factor Y)
VTGSGKTETYFEAVAEAIRLGRQTLVLLPEIALTQNFLRRFEARFGVAPVLWHSSLKSGERRRAWRAVAKASSSGGGRALGVFLPFPR